MRALETLLVRYVEKYGYDLEAIRKEYCGEHCGSEDLKVFTEIYNEEKEKQDNTCFFYSTLCFVNFVFSIVRIRTS